MFWRSSEALTTIPSIIARTFFDFNTYDVGSVHAPRYFAGYHQKKIPVGRQGADLNPTARGSGAGANGPAGACSRHVRSAARTARARSVTGRVGLLRPAHAQRPTVPGKRAA